MSLVERPAVKRVRAALEALGSKARVIELATTARTATDAAGALGCQQGAIVKSLVFRVAGSSVLALIAGDRRARQERIAVALVLRDLWREPTRTPSGMRLDTPSAGCHPWDTGFPCPR